MKTILDTDNVFTYLADLGYCQIVDRENVQIDLIPAKNFNLRLTFGNSKSLLVKQELHDDRGQTSGEFHRAWRMQQSLEHFSELGIRISKFLPELLHFDPDNSILVVNYRDDYQDLYKFYLKEHQFSVEIARAIGQLLATIHSQTFESSEYQQFLTEPKDCQTFTKETRHNRNYARDIIRRLSRITPDVFWMMPLECLQFFRLYQRFPSLSQAIADLDRSIVPSCLTHNDLKINNILLDLQWQLPNSQVISIIDWERVSWGDPAFDLGCLLGSYLEIWLDGLVIGTTLTIDESLQLAATPLELLQPSLCALVQSYLKGFPAIILTRPDYLDRAIQFAGLSLIQRIEIVIDEDRVFGNRGIIMLQIAKQLLCNPQAARTTLFGNNFN
jgi:Phosphotransferase enzyme family